MSKGRVIVILPEEPLTVAGGPLTPELIRELTDDDALEEGSKGSMTEPIESTKAHQPEASEYDPRAVAVIQSFIEQGMTHKEARAVFREAQILLCKLGDSTQLAAGPLSSILE